MTETRLEITDWVAQVLRELSLVAPAAAVDETTGLLGRGIGIDSMEALQLVVAAEARFDLTVDESELRPEHFRTVGSFADFLEGRMPAS
jgi:acyl carrier protein